MKCFYHKSDLDGCCSGAIVKMVHPECEMIGVDYDNKISEYDIFDGEIVFIVDFCFAPFTDMIELNKRVYLILIDHHKTTVENVKNHNFVTRGKSNICIGIGACELTWEFFLYNEAYYGGIGHSDKIPYSVKLLSKYDVWNHDDPAVIEFQTGMKAYEDVSPENIHFWHSVFYNKKFVHDTISKGRTFLEFVKIQNSNYVNEMSYEIEFEGYNAIVANTGLKNSALFDSIYNKDSHDIMIIFSVKNGNYRYSLYSDKPEIDVSEIAKRFGGGGHASAAGFILDKLIV